MWHFDLQSHIPSDIPGNVISQPYHNWMGWLEPPILRDCEKMRKIPLNKRTFRILLSKMVIYAIVQKL